MDDTSTIIEAVCPLTYCDALAVIDSDGPTVGPGSDMWWRQTCAAGHRCEVVLFAGP